MDPSLCNSWLVIIAVVVGGIKVFSIVMLTVALIWLLKSYLALVHKNRCEAPKATSRELKPLNLWSHEGEMELKEKVFFSPMFLRDFLSRYYTACTVDGKDCPSSKCKKSHFCNKTIIHNEDKESGASSKNQPPKDFVETNCHWGDCQKEFLTQQELVRHISNEHIFANQQPFICHWKECFRGKCTFRAQYMLFVHMRIHTGEKVHTFEGCSKAYFRYPNLKTHLNKHTGEILCKYPECGKRFTNFSDRIKHEYITHSIEKPYCKAPGCNKSYPDLGSLRKYVKYVHGAEYYANSKCIAEGGKEGEKDGHSDDNQESRSTTTIILDKDKDSGASSKNRPPKDFIETNCHWGDCQKEFLTQEELVKHIKEEHISANQTQFICKWKDCFRSKCPFRTEYMLVVHMRRHTGERPSKCTFEGCSKAYSGLENLIKHLRLHAREIFCRDPECGKGFTNYSDRIKHEYRTHSIERPYNCKVPGCNKKFPDHSSLHMHVKNRHGAEYYANSKRLGEEGKEGKKDGHNDDNQGKNSVVEPQYDTSLGQLTKKFLKLLSNSTDGDVNLNTASALLSVPKRHLYDITDVLEGAGLIQKTSRNVIQWMGRVSSPCASVNEIEGD